MNFRKLPVPAALSTLAFIVAACGGGDEPMELAVEYDYIPEFFTYVDGVPNDEQPELTVIAGSDESIANPNDLAFHPHKDRELELWVINEDSHTTGGSSVTLFDAGTEDQDYEWIRDGNAWHFMAMPPAMAFSDNGNWATGVGIQDANHDGGSFAGPSLWSSDFEIYGVVGDPPSAEFNGSHLDMLHGSPYAMGIAYERVPDNEWDNAFWVFDGYHGYMVRYDFHEPHYPGGYDHSNGRIHRYDEVEVERHESLPSHLIIDQETGWLYINDTGNNRVLRLDIHTGEVYRERGPLNEPLEEHFHLNEVVWEVFVDEGIDDPTGIALHDGRLFVSNHGTEEIIAFDSESGKELGRIDVGPGIRGITIGPDEKLWLAGYDNDEILRVDPR